MPMPAGCPEGKASSAQEKVAWSFEGDPLLNAKASFDPSFGVIHVVGSYAANARYRQYGNITTTTQSGTYEATITINAGKPTVLQIASL